MKPACARWVNVAVNIAMACSALMILYVLFIGGINVRFGEFVPSVGEAKLTCNEIRNPCLILLILLLLKPIVAYPAPFSRLRDRAVAHRRAILLAILVTGAAAIPRFLHLGAHSLNPDALLWIERGQKTIYALREHEFMRATAHLGHPGVVPAALIGASYVYLGDGTSTLSSDLLEPVTAGRFPIAGISKGEVFGSREARPGDFTGRMPTATSRSILRWPRRGASNSAWIARDPGMCGWTGSPSSAGETK